MDLVLIESDTDTKSDLHDPEGPGTFDLVYRGFCLMLPC